MRRLIWGFAGRTYHNVGNLMHWLILCLCMLGKSVSCFLWFAFVVVFSSKLTFFKNSIRNTIRVPNSLDPDQAVTASSQYRLHMFIVQTNSLYCLYLFASWVILYPVLLRSAVVVVFSTKLTLSKNSIRNTTYKVPNSLDPDQARHIVRPDLDPNCLQRLWVEDTSMQRVNVPFNNLLVIS